MSFCPYPDCGQPSRAPTQSGSGRSPIYCAKHAKQSTRRTRRGQSANRLAAAAASAPHHELAPAAQRRICTGCGELFDVRDSRQRYCTLLCFELATRSTRRRWRPSPVLALLIAFALLPLTARAQGYVIVNPANAVTVSWNAVTQNTDDSAIAAPVTYDVYETDAAADAQCWIGETDSLTWHVTIWADLGNCSLTSGGIPNGAAPLYDVAAVDSLGRRSDFSAAAGASFPGISPAAAGALAVKVIE